MAIIIIILIGLLLAPIFHLILSSAGRRSSSVPTTSSSSKAGLVDPPGADRWFLPLVGETLNFMNDAPGFLSKSQRRYGNVFCTHLFGEPRLVMIGANAFAFLFEEERKGRIMSVNAQLKSFKEMLGEKILNEREDHSFHRAMVTQPILGRKVLQAMIPKIQANLARRAEKWVGQGSQYFEWYTEFKEWAFDNASALVWGSDITQPSEQRRQLFELFEDMNRGLTCLPCKLPGTRYSKCMRSRKKFGEIVGRLVEERTATIKRRMTELSEEEAPQQKLDFEMLGLQDDLMNNYLFALIKLKRELPTDEVVDLIAGLYFAAYHTVTSGLVNLLVALERRPDIRQKVIEEQEAIVGDSKDWFTYEQLNTMVYLQKVIKETLRLVPPATGIIRKVGSEDIEFNGYRLRAGQSIYANIILTQRDPTYFTDPETFDPERFSLDRSEDQKAKFAWVAFGGGAHSCVGMKMAILEMKLVASFLVRDYEWKSLAGQDMKIGWATVSPSPKDCYKVCLSKKAK